MLNLPKNGASLSEVMYITTTQTADAIKNLKLRKKLPFSVKIHVIFISNEITKDIILLLSHGLVLAMADD